MADSQIPTYHLAPHFSIPPPPSGPLDLGSIIASLHTVSVLNEDSHLPVPHSRIYCHHKRGFTASRTRLQRAEFGVWARFVGLEGLGGEASFAREHAATDEYSFEGEDTMYFAPTADYVRESMAAREVAEWVEGSGGDPVYMVTGLKIARGPAVRIGQSRKRDVVFEVGAQVPGGVPVQVGPKIKPSREENVEQGWEYSEDFVVGIRAKKLVYKKALFSRKRGELSSSDYIKGATLFDGSETKDAGDDDVLELDFEEELEGKRQVLETNDETESSWIVPILNQEEAYK